MNGEEKTEAVVSQSDLKWLEKRMDRIGERITKQDKKIRIIIGLLVDKKIIGVELAKRIEESKHENIGELIEWLMLTLNKE